MFKKIAQNKKWIFSGVGCALPSFFILSILAPLATVVSQRLLPAPVILRATIIEDTTPQDLKDWISLASATKVDVIEENSNENLSESDELIRQNQVYRANEFSSLLNSPVVKKLRKSRRYDIDKIVLEINNNSRETISDVQLRVDSLYSLWSIEAEGPFLTPSKRKELLGRAIESYSNNALIFESLPEIPARSSLQIIVYGDIYKDSFHSGGVSLRTPGKTNRIKPVYSVEDSTFVRIQRRPVQFFSLVFITAFSIGWQGVLWWPTIKKRIKAKALYQTAGEFALNGKNEIAMSLLYKAVKAGWSKKEYAMNDREFKSLKEREDFQKLFSSKKPVD